MTDKEKLNAIRAEVQNYIDAAHKAHTNITEGNFAHLLSFIDSMQEEPASKDKFTFTSLPRLLDRIKPTDRAKWYSSRLADALEKEGYITDAKIVRESIKLMNGEKVPMATMDEEPVSEDLEEEPTIPDIVDEHYWEMLGEESVSDDLLVVANKAWLESEDKESYADTFVDGFVACFNWQKRKDSTPSKDLEELINTLSKRYPEVSFAKLSRIAVRVAKWKKEHLWKPADGDDLPEIDREVIALLDNGKVVFAHRPPEYWDGKDIVTGKVTRHYPKTYDKGGWNIPDTKWWLDVELPKF